MMNKVVCKCRICKRTKRVKKILESRKPTELRRLVEELFDELMQVEDDLNYHQAILDGSWPSAETQLEAALVKAREINAVETGK